MATVISLRSPQWFLTKLDDLADINEAGAFTEICDAAVDAIRRQTIETALDTFYAALGAFEEGSRSYNLHPKPYRQFLLSIFPRADVDAAMGTGSFDGETSVAKEQEEKRQEEKKELDKKVEGNKDSNMTPGEDRQEESDYVAGVGWYPRDDNGSSRNAGTLQRQYSTSRHLDTAHLQKRGESEGHHRLRAKDFQKSEAKVGASFTNVRTGAEHPAVHSQTPSPKQRLTAFHWTFSGFFMSALFTAPFGTLHDTFWWLVFICVAVLVLAAQQVIDK